MQHSLGLANPTEYDSLFSSKRELTQNEFNQYTSLPIESFSSPSDHFRMRAEFKIWHQDGKADYAMYKPGEYKKPVVINEFSIGSKKICDLMLPLLAAINSSELLKRKLFQVEFLTTRTGEAVTTLIYHKALDALWEAEAKPLEQALGTHIIGRSRGQKLVLSQDHVIETFNVNNKTFQYQQVETGFTQPNGFVCEDMLNWAVEASKDIGGDLIELYCGNGNFTLPLAMNFEKVLATEVSKTSVKSALFNIELNKNTNIKIARMSSEEFTQALNGEREFRRLKDIELDEYRLTTIFVDPPRSGLDKETEKMVTRFDNILYISCNPETLRGNLDHICQTHEITRFAFFDQFPYTDHRECGVMLKRKA